MRLFLLLSLLQAPQDDRSVRELIRQLDDDSYEVRERATTALSDLEPAALAGLKDAMKGASPEARSRLHRAVRRIEDRQALRSKFRPASLVTLEGRDRPLSLLLEDLARQAPTPIDLSGVPEGEKATVSFSKLPFWEALDRVCGAGGAFTWAVDSGRVCLKKGKPTAEPGRFSGPFAVHLKGAEASKDELSIRLLAVWESGLNPDGLTFRFREMKDDQGTDLLGDDPDGDPFGGRSASRQDLSYDTSFRTGVLPHERATKLSRLWVRIGFEFVLRSVTLEFKDPAGKAGQTLTSEGVSVKLERFEEGENQTGGSLAISLADERSVPSDLVGVVLKHEGDKETHVGVSSIERGRLQTSFSLGGGPQKVGKTSGIRVTIPTAVHTEALDLDLRDVPLRR